jgi:hypothetical protein
MGQIVKKLCSDPHTDPHTDAYLIHYTMGASEKDEEEAIRKAEGGKR